jgi:hypothetical protein
LNGGLGHANSNLATDGAPMHTDEESEEDLATDEHRCTQIINAERQLFASMFICAPSVTKPNEFVFIGVHLCPIGG